MKYNKKYQASRLFVDHQTINHLEHSHIYAMISVLTNNMEAILTRIHRSCVPEILSTLGVLKLSQIKQSNSFREKMYPIFMPFFVEKNMLNASEHFLDALTILHAIQTKNDAFFSQQFEFLSTATPEYKAQFMDAATVVLGKHLDELQREITAHPDSQLLSQSSGTTFFQQQPERVEEKAAEEAKAPNDAPPSNEHNIVGNLA